MRLEWERAHNIYKGLVSKMPNPDKWHPEIKADYILLDLETTGFDPELNRIVLLGVMPVFNGEPYKDQAIDVLINTPYDPCTWQASYSSCHPMGDTVNELLKSHCADTGIELAYVKKCIDDNSGSIYDLPEGLIPDVLLADIDSSGKPRYQTAKDVTGLTSEYTSKVGEDRVDCLSTLLDVLNIAKREGVPLVGHNLVNFDLPFIFYELHKFLEVDYQWEENLVLDTGMIVKASQIPEEISRPLKEDTIYTWCKRMANFRARAPWALDSYCVGAYELDKRYGVDTTKQHQSAAYDCEVTNHLLRAMADGPE